MRETPRPSRRDDDLAADDGQLLQIRRRVPKASVHKQRANSHCAGIEVAYRYTADLSSCLHAELAANASAILGRRLVRDQCAG